MIRLIRVDATSPTVTKGCGCRIGTTSSRSSPRAHDDFATTAWSTCDLREQGEHRRARTYTSFNRAIDAPTWTPAAVSLASAAELMALALFAGIRVRDFAAARR